MGDSETFMLKILNLQIVAGTANIRDEIFKGDTTFQNTIPKPAQAIYRRWILTAFESEPSTMSRVSKYGVTANEVINGILANEFPGTTYKKTIRNLMAGFKWRSSMTFMTFNDEFDVIKEACDEHISGKFDEEEIIDIYKHALPAKYSSEVLAAALAAHPAAACARQPQHSQFIKQ